MSHAAARASASPAPFAVAELADGRTLTLVEVGPERARDVRDVVLSAFAARPVLGAPAAALADTPAAVAAALSEGRGVLGLVDGEPAATLLEVGGPGEVRLTRVAVRPEFQRLGVAGFLVGAVLEELAVRRVDRVVVLARKEYPRVQQWWGRHAFTAVGDEGDCWVLARELPVAVAASGAEEMRDLGRRLAGVLRAGDLLVATGSLGAGKTTLAQGIGAGLAVAGPIISPTFVLSRVHPSTVGGPALVHVDAYRLASAAELEDIDVQASLADSVTLVEWGEGLAEGLASDRLEILIRRSGDPDDETRRVFFTPVGDRWDRAVLASAVRQETP